MIDLTPPLKINLPIITDERGSLVVVEKLSLFTVKRFFYIVGKKNIQRGGHAHKKTKMLLLCIHGQVEIIINYNSLEEKHLLEPLGYALFLEPYHWHKMNFMTDDSVLFVVASEEYDKHDYIFEKL